MTTKRSDYATGVILLVAAAVTYSTAGIFTKGVVAGAWAVIFWRGLFAALFTTLWTLQRGTARAQFGQMGKAGRAVGVIGAIGTAAFIPAFKLTSIANVALIYAAAPLLAAIMAWVAIGERITRRTLIGALLAIGGVGVIVSGSIGSLDLIGDGLALVMTLVMATIMVIYRVYPETPGAGPSVMQSLFLLPPSFVFGQPLQTASFEIVILAAFGLLFAIASVTLAEGAKRVPSGQTALISALETPLAPLLAFLVFFEIPSTATVIGGAAVLFGVIYSIRVEKHQGTVAKQNLAKPSFAKSQRLSRFGLEAAMRRRGARSASKAGRQDALGPKLPLARLSSFCGRARSSDIRCRCKMHRA